MFHTRLFCCLVLLACWMFLLGCERDCPKSAEGEQKEIPPRIKVEAKEICSEMERRLRQGIDPLGFVTNLRARVQAHSDKAEADSLLKEVRRYVLNLKIDHADESRWRQSYRYFSSAAKMVSLGASLNGDAGRWDAFSFDLEMVRRLKSEMEKLTVSSPRGMSRVRTIMASDFEDWCDFEFERDVDCPLGRYWRTAPDEEKKKIEAAFREEFGHVPVWMTGR